LYFFVQIILIEGFILYLHKKYIVIIYDLWIKNYTIQFIWKKTKDSHMHVFCSFDSIYKMKRNMLRPNYFLNSISIGNKSIADIIYIGWDDSYPHPLKDSSGALNLLFFVGNIRN